MNFNDDPFLSFIEGYSVPDYNQEKPKDKDPFELFIEQQEKQTEPIKKEYQPPSGLYTSPEGKQYGNYEQYLQEKRGAAMIQKPTGEWARDYTKPLPEQFKSGVTEEQLKPSLGEKIVMGGEDVVNAIPPLKEAFRAIPTFYEGWFKGWSGGAKQLEYLTGIFGENPIQKMFKNAAESGQSIAQQLHEAGVPDDFSGKLVQAMGQGAAEASKIMMTAGTPIPGGGVSPGIGGAAFPVISGVGGAQQAKEQGGGIKEQFLGAGRGAMEGALTQGILHGTGQMMPAPRTALNTALFTGTGLASGENIQDALANAIGNTLVGGFEGGNKAKTLKQNFIDAYKKGSAAVQEVQTGAKLNYPQAGDELLPETETNRPVRVNEVYEGPSIEDPSRPANILDVSNAVNAKMEMGQMPDGTPYTTIRQIENVSHGTEQYEQGRGRHVYDAAIDQAIKKDGVFLSDKLGEEPGAENIILDIAKQRGLNAKAIGENEAGGTRWEISKPIEKPTVNVPPEPPAPEVKPTGPDIGMSEFTHGQYEIPYEKTSKENRGIEAQKIIDESGGDARMATQKIISKINNGEKINDNEQRVFTIYSKELQNKIDNETNPEAKKNLLNELRDLIPQFGKRASEIGQELQQLKENYQDGGPLGTLAQVQKTIERNFEIPIKKVKAETETISNKIENEINKISKTISEENRIKEAEKIIRKYMPKETKPGKILSNVDKLVEIYKSGGFEKGNPELRKLVGEYLQKKYKIPGMTDELMDGVMEFTKKLDSHPTEDVARWKIIFDMGKYIGKHVQNKSTKEKIIENLTAYHTIGMLSNPKTILKNMTGNSARVAWQMVSDNVLAAPIDKIWSMVSKEGKRVLVFKPLKGAKEFYSGATDEGFKAVGENWTLGTDFSINRLREYGKKLGIAEPEIERIMKAQGMYETAKKFEIREEKNRVSKMMSAALNGVDRMFFFGEFHRTFENMVSAEAASKNPDTSPKRMAEIYEQAMAEGLSATYQNRSISATAAVNIKNSLNKLMPFLGEVVIKFPKTPMNIYNAVLKNSPLGYLNTIMLIKKMINLKGTGMSSTSQIATKEQLQRGSTQYGDIRRELIRSFSRTTLSTAALYYGIGWVGAGMGAVISSLGSKSEKEKKTKEAIGKNEGTMNIGQYTRGLFFGDSSPQKGDNYNTLEWLGDAGLLIDLGARAREIADIPKENMNAGQKILAAGGALVETFAAASDIISQIPAMKGIKTIARGNPGKAATDLIASLPGQLVPSIWKAVINASDPLRRDTSAENVIDKMVNDVKKYVPGQRETLPIMVKVNGKPYRFFDEKANIFEKVFDLTILPTIKYPYEKDRGLEYVLKLYNKTGDNGVLPTDYSKRDTIVYSKNYKLKLNPELRNRLQEMFSTSFLNYINDPETMKMLEEEKDLETQSYRIKQFVSYYGKKAEDNLLNWLQDTYGDKWTDFLVKPK